MPLYFIIVCYAILYYNIHHRNKLPHIALYITIPCYTKQSLAVAYNHAIWSILYYTTLHYTTTHDILIVLLIPGMCFMIAPGWFVFNALSVLVAALLCDATYCPAKYRVFVEARY